MTAPNSSLRTPMGQVRSKRNGLISQCEWMRFRHLDEIALSRATTLTNAQYLELLAYIQSLRGCPDPGITNPASVVWPTPPSFVPSS